VTDALGVTFLGTGAAMVTGHRYQSGIALTEGDECLLVDCGSGVLHRLEQSDIGYERIDRVLLTHHHLDHVADLLPLMKARWLAGETALEIVGPEGTSALVEGLLDVHDYMRDRIDLSLRDIGPGDHVVGPWSIEAVETIHSVTCLGYRFDDRLAISGDTEPSEAVIDLAEGVGIFVHECAFPDDVEVSNHTRPSELGAILAERTFGRVYLTHLYPHCEGREGEMTAAVEERADVDCRVAEDLLSVRVSANHDG